LYQNSLQIGAVNCIRYKENGRLVRIIKNEYMIILISNLKHRSNKIAHHVVEVLGLSGGAQAAFRTFKEAS